MPAWPTITDRVPGATESASDFNTQVLDALRWLFDPVSKYGVYLDNAADYTTSSTTFADIDAAGDPDLSQAVTTYGEDLLIIAQLSGTHSATSGRVYYDIAVDATRLGTDDGSNMFANPAGESATRQTNTVVGYATGLAAGSHTVSVQYKTSGATATVYGGGTSNYDVHALFLIIPV